MANQITNDKAGQGKYLQLSNGGTSVLIAVLLLSGSDLAANEWQQELVTWLAEHDQLVFGLGVVGFDLDEIAWDKEQFEEQKAFVLKMIELAQTRHRWDKLDYDPPFASEYLETLHSMVEDYRLEFVMEGKAWDWRVEPDEFSKCPLHGVYKHVEGCTICNDM